MKTKLYMVSGDSSVYDSLEEVMDEVDYDVEVFEFTARSIGILRSKRVFLEKPKKEKKRKKGGKNE